MINSFSDATYRSSQYDGENAIRKFSIMSRCLWMLKSSICNEQRVYENLSLVVLKADLIWMAVERGYEC